MTLACTTCQAFFAPSDLQPTAACLLPGSMENNCGHPSFEAACLRICRPRCLRQRQTGRSMVFQRAASGALLSDSASHASGRGARPLPARVWSLSATTWPSAAGTRSGALRFGQPGAASGSPQTRSWSCRLWAAQPGLCSTGSLSCRVAMRRHARRSACASKPWATTARCSCQAMLPAERSSLSSQSSGSRQLAGAQRQARLHLARRKRRPPPPSPPPRVPPLPGMWAGAWGGSAASLAGSPCLISQPRPLARSRGWGIRQGTVQIEFPQLQVRSI
mmetsp:Transcript_63097/g.179386  ORF Transcript_63097/g.179386 Transcript_63097/m.179386 type:complete len:276 (+) Transcript_63097:1888-2715(+)